jgi:hypothetical protein
MRFVSCKGRALPSMVIWAMGIICLLEVPSFAQTVRTSANGIVVTMDSNLPLERFVEPEPPAEGLFAADEVAGSVQVKVSIRSDGSVAQVIPIKRANVSLFMEIEKALKKWRYDPASLNGMRQPVQTLVTVEFPPPAPHNSGKLLMETDLYRVTEHNMQGTKWCFPRDTGYQANINIIWRVTDQEDLTGKSAGYQHHLADIWSEVIQNCPATTMAYIENYVAGVRLLSHDGSEVAEAVSLKAFGREVPISIIMVIEQADGTLKSQQGGMPSYQNLEAARAQRKPATTVTLPPPPRPLMGSEPSPLQ